MVANRPLTGKDSSDQVQRDPSEGLPECLLLLENGDRLTQDEFERRYRAASHIKKAELVEGVVYVASPLRFRSHSKPHGDLIIWLGNYKTATPGAELGIEPTLRLDLNNQPQPDGVLLVEAWAGGQARITEDDYVEGAPELVVEVAASIAAYDLHDKKQAYRRNGVQEYIVWQIFENKLEWFCLREGEYVLLSDQAGVVQSQVFPGLWLAVSDLLAGNMVKVLAVLQEGLSSPEHAEFVQRLSEGRS